MTPFLILPAAGTGLMLVLWAIQLRTQDAATADVGWALLIAGGAVAAALLLDGDPWRRVLVAGLTATWALRLAVYLLRDRVWARRGEDGRYRAPREFWGRRWRGSAPNRRTAAPSAVSDCGAIRGIPTTSSSGCTGGRTC